jgi:hypothetical protein
MRIVFRNVSSNVICIAGLGSPVFDVYKETQGDSKASADVIYDIEKQELQQLYDGFRELAAMVSGSCILPDEEALTATVVSIRMTVNTSATTFHG